jgi:putative surface-exposed virulence protein
MARIKGLMIGFSFLLVIIFTFVFTTPVLAEGETPPEATPVVDTTPTPTEEVLPTAEATVEPTEEAATSAALDPTAEATVEAVLDGETVTPEQALVEALAASDLVLTDANGDAVPMASEVASDVAEGADPYFIAGGVYYGYSDGLTCNALVLPVNCTISVSNPIVAAITAYTTTYVATATGPIFIEGGTAATPKTYTVNSNITITSGSNLTGLVGSGSATTIININPTFNLNVSNTIKGFTLSGLTINGVIDSSGGKALVDFTNNTGALTLTDVVVYNSNATGDGIEITGQTGAVTMNKVQSSSNGDEGAKITTTGNVTISNSEFDLNHPSSGLAGLDVNATGLVTISTTSVSENDYVGASISANAGVKITDSVFERNGKTGGSGLGLTIEPGSKGAISLTNVFANDNRDTNINIDNVSGAVTLTGIEADGSDAGNGIYIDTCNGSGSACDPTLGVGPVTLTNVKASSNNQSNIIIFSSGAVTATGVDADYSSNGYGLVIYNYETVSPQNVTVSSANVNGNLMSNLYIWTKGNVTLNHITASYSGNADGININATYGNGTVTLLNTLGPNDVYGAQEYGIMVNSKGTITINQITADSTRNTAISLNNTFGTGSIILKNASANYSNADHTSDASVYIMSNGAVTISTLNASYGYGIGAWISNSTGNAPITITDANIYYNDNDGLDVFSKGTITLTRIIAYQNNDDVAESHLYGGIYLDNTSGSGGVTINSSSSNDSYNGWTINTHGAVSINDIDARYNTLQGLVIANNGAPTTSPAVTLKLGDISSNGSTGLEIDSKGLITLTSTSVHHNNASSLCTQCNAIIDNSFGTGGVTFTGTTGFENYFGYGNNSNGVTITTNGPVSLNKLYVYNNDVYGLVINNGGTGAVTVSNIHSTDNTNSGIYITAKGTVTIYNPTVENNDSSEGGIYVDNTAGTGNIVVARSGTNCDNYGTYCSIYQNENGALGYGLYLLSKGSVTLSYLDVEDSPQAGVYIGNTSGTGNVTLTGVDANYMTAGPGIYIESHGVVTLTDIEAMYNPSFGIEIDNHNVVGKAVTITRANTGNNGNDGINILSAGAVTLAGISSSSNTGSSRGLTVDNHYGTGGITITYSGAVTNYFNSNAGANGIYLVSLGPIIINKTSATNNGPTNIYLNNASSTAAITMNTVSASNSVSGEGIFINTNGAVSMSNITAYNNAGGRGLNISAGGAVTIANVVSSGNNGDGIHVVTNGAITITNPIVEYNVTSGYGVYLNNSGGTGAVIVQRVGTQCAQYYPYCSIYQNRNGASGEGLYILSNGAVTVTYTNITYSPTNGLWIDNSTGSGAVVITGVTITQIANQNGIHVVSNGTVTMTDVNASNVGALGIYVDNHNVIGKAVSITRSITNYDGTTGVYIISAGPVTLAGMESSNNLGGSDGIYVDNHYGTGGITLTYSGAVKNQINSNTGGYGLYFTTLGPIVINQATVSASSGPNIFLNNPTSTGSVTLNTVTSNGSSGGNGVFIRTQGNVSVTNLQTYSNLNTELDINNSTGTGSVTIVNTSVSSSDTGDGIRVTSNGAITVTNTSSTSNGAGSSGIFDNSAAPTGAPGITIQNSGSLFNSFDYSQYGLSIYSKGPVIITNTHSEGISTGDALYIDNTYGSSPVTLTKVSAIAYNNLAISVNSHGAVTGSTISGDGSSTAYAIYIDNCDWDGVLLDCTGSGNITLNTVTANNSGVGLYVTTPGAIAITNLTASDNWSSSLTSWGAYLDNTYSATNAPISVLKAVTSNNDAGGLDIYSNGLVTLDGITAEYNNGDSTAGVSGVYVDNMGGTANVVVSALKGPNTFNNTYNGNGLTILTNGTITVTKATANWNGRTGLSLSTSGAAKAITLNTITTNHNGYQGINASATAASTFSYVKAYDNGIGSGYDGIYVDTNGNNNFTLISSYISGNGYSGLYADVGTGTAFVKGCFYYGNGRYGSGDTANLRVNGGATLMIS